MKGLLIYYSKNGATKTCAQRLRNMLQGEWELVQLGKTSSPALASYDIVLLGGPIRYQRLPKPVRTWMRRHGDEIKTIPHGIFACHGMPAQQVEFKKYFTPSWVEKAVAKGAFGGEYRMQGASFVDRKVMQIVTNKMKEQPQLDDEAIQAFAEAVNQAI